MLRGPVIAPGGHCGTAPYSAGKRWCLCRKDAWGMGLFAKRNLSSEMNQKQCEYGGTGGGSQGEAKRE